MKKILFFTTLVIWATLFINRSISSKENRITANIEALAGNIEEGVKIRSCYLDKDIIEDLSAASKYTICNSQTTSSVMYKCGKDKQGGFKEYSTPTSYKCMY